MSPILLRRLSDEHLGSRLAAGEAAAFDELYRRYVHRLAAYGAHLLGDGSAGDDVAQSALLSAYAALRDGRMPDRVRPWLYRIAHNAAIDHVRRRRELPSEFVAEAPAAPTGGEAGALVAALVALPDRQRRVYVLRELHGLRVDETAAELGLTVSQVEQSLFAARNRMAEHLVFGDRLNCVTVRRLAAGPLDLGERRALKTHLHSCAGCRAALGRRGRALLLPVAPLEWLRALGGLLVGAGAPAAAKVGVVVASTSLVAGVPITVERSNHRALPPPVTTTPARVVRAVVAHPVRTAVVHVEHAEHAATAAAAPAAVRTAPGERGRPHREERRRLPRVSSGDRSSTSGLDGGGDGSSRGPGGGGHGGGPGPAAAAPVTTAAAAAIPPVTTTTSSSDGPGRGGGGSDGGGSEGGGGSGSGDGGSGSGSGGSGSAGGPGPDGGSGGHGDG